MAAARYVYLMRVGNRWRAVAGVRYSNPNTTCLAHADNFFEARGWFGGRTRYRDQATAQKNFAGFATDFIEWDGGT